MLKVMVGIFQDALPIGGPTDSFFQAGGSDDRRVFWTLSGSEAHIGLCCMRSVLLVLTLSTDFNVETRFVLLRALIGQSCSSTAMQETLFCGNIFLAGGATTLLRVELTVDFHTVCAAYFL